MPTALTDPRAVARGFRAVALAEAVSWGLLLVGMFLKRVVHVTDLGVQVFGALHGVVFLAYLLATALCWRALRWSAATVLLALAASLPPFCTAWFERWAQRTGRLPLTTAAPAPQAA